jgi:hypothetical protein
MLKNCMCCRPKKAQKQHDVKLYDPSQCTFEDLTSMTPLESGETCQIVEINGYDTRGY